MRFEDFLYPYLVQNVEEKLIANVLSFSEVGPVENTSINDIFLESFLDYHVLSYLSEE